MAFEGVEQFVGRLARLRKVRHDAADADGNAFLIRVEEAHAGHAARDSSGGLDHDALVAGEIETRFNDFGGKKMHFLDR